MPAKKKETIQLKGHLDIRQAESIQDTLNKSIKKNASLILDLTQADDIDFAVIQLLFSLKRTLNKNKNDLYIEGVNDKITEKIVLCDFKDLLQEH